MRGWVSSPAGMMRSVLRLHALLAVAISPGMAAQPLTRPAGPLDVGDRRQVFIDDLLLTDSKDVRLTVHPPRKTGELTIHPEHPWEKGIGPYSTVGRVGDTYHMWYHAMDALQWHTAKDRGAVCYARSKDGIHWEKPMLGITEFAGSRDNNIVIGHGAGGVVIGQDGGMVFVDPTAPEDQRFRLAIKVADLGEGVHVFSSPDGTHWHLTHKAVLRARPEKRGHHLDSQNVIFWDGRLKKYVAYARRNLMGSGSQGRAVARGESDRLDGFPAVQDFQVVMAHDKLDLRYGDVAAVDYYTNATIKYPWADDAYYTFPTVYYHYLPGLLREFPEEIPTNAGPLHGQFAASRDGIHWQRYDRRPFVDLGMDGEFDCRAARVIYGLVPDVEEREMYMYYLGSDWLHGWDRDERNKRLLTEAGLGPIRNLTAISRLVLRRDGFVSVRGAYTGGEFMTPLLRFQGGELRLNVDTSATGNVKVEILDENGSPLDGYRLADCDLIHTANEINRRVSWRGKTDIIHLAGKPIRLHFQIRDADLYAFQFRQ